MRNAVVLALSLQMVGMPLVLAAPDYKDPQKQTQALSELINRNEVPEDPAAVDTLPPGKIEPTPAAKPVAETPAEKAAPAAAANAQTVNQKSDANLLVNYYKIDLSNPQVRAHLGRALYRLPGGG